MKNKKITLLVCLFMAMCGAYAGPDPNFHIYLCFGQSNMEGQGPIESQDNNVDKRFQMMAAVNCSNRTKGNWYTATPPLCRCNTGLCPADYFGREMVKGMGDSIRVGVIVVAVAGCDIQLFEKDKYQSYVSSAASWMQSYINEYGGNPYGRLIEIAKLAQKDGVIKGILVHQGETNTGQSNWPSRVKGVYDNIIKDLSLNAEKTPLLVGEVVPGGSCGSHNNIIAQVPNTIPNSYVISASGLVDKGDGLHFTSEGYRTLGKRYAEQMLKVVDMDYETGSNGSEDPEDPGKSDYTMDLDPLMIQTEAMPTIGGEYCQKYNDKFEGMAYYANNDYTEAIITFKKGDNYNIKLNGCADANVTAKVTLSIGDQKLEYEWNSNTPDTVSHNLNIAAGTYNIKVTMETDQGQSDAFVDYILITKDTATTSLNEDNTNKKIIVYPNPCKDRIYIQGADNVQNFEIIDQVGRTILEGEECRSIQVSSIKKGTYILKIQTISNSFIYQTFIKD